ncbi:Lrp/AsnC ligand binding domain-containing protein [Acerihabitans sp. TG2]|uniref:Lrp/AsnC family transcriptional regulator n=1 Tax=Acerihabitans sp. TG2 TaxID=3096008 RepID=UPI002B22CCA1|nr:Lrp/AsnC ligand binding domain-containing protein [Acerihabitans sp. TG2]MEA9392086.1 Lrp/AsnC ligand binding domain-containing protein [Acerihabitans sp. TG2]
MEQQKNAEVAGSDKALDRFDMAILRILQLDGSVSNVALANKINLSPPACLRRVERLKQLGFIKKYVALLNPQTLNAGLVVMIGVVLDRSTPESFKDFEGAVSKIRGCMECHMVSGEFDYIMLIRTADNQSFNKLHAEQLLFLPGVRQIRSFIGLREVFSTTQIPL